MDDILKRLTSVESRLQTLTETLPLALAAENSKLENRLIKWIVGTGLTSVGASLTFVGLMLGIAKLFF